MAYVERHKAEMMESILACLKNRIRNHHPELLTNVLTVLATHGWNKSDDINFAATKPDNLVQQFLTPLETSGVETVNINEEWEDMVEYGRDYLNIAEEDNYSIAQTVKMENVLTLIVLTFCLPMANGRVECAGHAPRPPRRQNALHFGVCFTVERPLINVRTFITDVQSLFIMV